MITPLIVIIVIRFIIVTISSIKRENNRKSRLAPEGFKGKNARTRLLYNHSAQNPRAELKVIITIIITVTTINDPSTKKENIYHVSPDYCEDDADLKALVSGTFFSNCCII